jgi:hypothetical protein
MKQIVLFVAVLACASIACAGPCVSGTLQDFINLGASGCQSGFATFTGFTTEPGQTVASPINPSMVLVTPGGSTLNPTLQFTLDLTASANHVFESFFRFGVSAPLPLSDTMLLDGSATVDGAATATQDICPGGSFSGNSPVGCPGSAASLVTVATESFSMKSDTASFPVSGFFDVFVDLTVDGGLSGSATLRSATAQFTATPEPGSTALMLTGLAALALRRVRRLF